MPQIEHSATVNLGERTTVAELISAIDSLKANQQIPKDAVITWKKTRLGTNQMNEYEAVTGFTITWTS